MASASADPAKEKTKESASQLSGEWEQESHSVLSGAKELINEKDLMIEIHGQTMEFWTGEAKGEFRALLVSAGFVLQPSATPAHFDLTLKWRDGDQKRLGIYKIDGDSMTICWGETRPTKFECGGKDGAGSFLAIFKRIKR